MMGISPMTTVPTTDADEAPPALQRALVQSHEVKDKVEACADDLAGANEGILQQIAAGATTLAAAKQLEDGQSVEAKVQECVDDLHQVTDVLAQGVEDLKRVEATLAASRVSEREATHRAMHDAATGLPNRGLFDDRLAHGIATADRHAWTLAVFFIDLDQFKQINDTHGHATGDAVLKEVARRLSSNARDEDTVCRNGGDEFLYLLVDPKGQANVESMAVEVLKDLARPMEIAGLSFVIRASIGIAMYPADGISVVELVQCADEAMYQAKRHARGYARHGSSTEPRAG